MQWPQVDIFRPPRPIAGFEYDPGEFADVDVKAECPYYLLVPKGYWENLAFREEVLKYAAGSKSAREELWSMCSRDVLFFINTFLFTYDPRLVSDGKSPVVPWITYPYQDRLLLALLRCIGVSDLCVRKSRDMGASWSFLAAVYWRWKFREMETFLLVSRNAELVDSSGEPDSLFWKLDFFEKSEYMPGWLSSPKDRTSMHMENLNTGCTIDGASTTGNVGRGGRRTAVLMDEFASFGSPMDVEALAATQNVTRSRIYNSTPKGRGTAYYNVSVNPSIKHVFLHWTLHPEKVYGLGIDPKGNPTSPWRDMEEKRCPIPFILQQELEMDDLAAERPFFESAMIERLMGGAEEWVSEGSLEFDEEMLEPKGFVEVDGGPLRLWCELGRGGRPDSDREYVIGADISTGGGTETTSNSVLSVIDCRSRKIVAEFVSNQYTPDQFAKIAVAMCRWFGGLCGSGAFLIWEANGAGVSFGKVVVESGYGRFFRRLLNEFDLRKKQTAQPGWWSTAQSKLWLLGEYGRALREGELFNPSRLSLMELYNYQHKNGTVVWVGTGADVDVTGISESHGDRVIAASMAWRLAKDRKAAQEDGEESIPVGSLAWRREQAKKARRSMSNLDTASRYY